MAETTIELDDERLLEVLRSRGSLSVAETMQVGGVTATAVRQRFGRLMRKGLVERITQRQGRGRPEHRYSLTEKARRQSGHNYSDLTLALWSEMRRITDPEIRRGLLQRVADSLTCMYRDEVTGATPEARMRDLQRLLSDRRISTEVDSSASGETAMPTLRVLDCPYPELAERDRGVCAMEKMMFAELIQAPLNLAQCRLDGHACCQFESR